ncbi:hypothetical protein [Caulobacter sp. UC70_42]|uniref:hypothetical protein n=1 Tax=Caulobacter sp. UC70_42 TaxID=3374551 RepID=UPI003756BC1A
MNTPRNDAEPPDIDTKVEHALEHLKEAERDLEQAHKAEHRAEDEIHKAEHEIEEALAHRNTEIIVNSRPARFTVTSRPSSRSCNWPSRAAPPTRTPSTP